MHKHKNSGDNCCNKKEFIKENDKSVQGKHKNTKLGDVTKN